MKLSLAFLCFKRFLIFLFIEVMFSAELFLLCQMSLRQCCQYGDVNEFKYEQRRSVISLLFVIEEDSVFLGV